MQFVMIDGRPALLQPHQQRCAWLPDHFRLVEAPIGNVVGVCDANCVWIPLAWEPAPENATVVESAK